jgi:hypothetical protein
MEMNARVDQLLNEALSLPETERVALADALYASVDGPLKRTRFGKFLLEFQTKYFSNLSRGVPL